jgi:hypothetical protein
VIGATMKLMGHVDLDPTPQVHLPSDRPRCRTVPVRMMRSIGVTVMPLSLFLEMAPAVAGDHRIMLWLHLNRTMHTKGTVQEMRTFERICSWCSGHQCDFHRLV